MVKVENLSAGYGKTEILHNIDFYAAEGKITTIIGKNGCGKSTLMKVLSGILPVSGGRVKICGKFINEIIPSERAKLTAYLPQCKNTYDITVGRMVLYGRFPYLSYPRKYRKSDYEIVHEAMKRMGILDFEDSLLSELSGGTRQKVYIAMMLAQCTPVIVMDEPTSYLDIGQQMNFFKITREIVQDGKTIILVLHDLLTAFKISDYIYVMEKGKIIMHGEPREVLNSNIVKKLYGIDICETDTCQGKQYYYLM